VAEKGAPPPRLAVERILCPLGSNDYRGAERPVGIPADQLTRHMAILGGTGSGKTNLMKVAFSPLLEQGYGMAVLDPKGNLAQGFLDLVPQHRINDVIWFDPTDREYPPALNILQASGDLSPDELAGELMIGLKRIFTGSSEFGPRMEWILRMAVRTLLDSEGEKTLYDVRRFLEEASFRTRVLGSVKDQRLRRFWQGRNLSHNIIDPLLNRLSTFLDRPSIRDVVCQPNRIDFHHVMREGKIFIANLEKGRLQEAAYILGSFILSRLQLAALARRTGERKLFPVLVDEFHNFAGHGLDTESIETFLSETRSYQAPLVVSTQYLGRLNRSVVAALFGNLGTQVCLNMGQADAQLLQRELGRFTAEDLLNLGIGHAIVRMGPARDTFNVRIPLAGKRESHRAAVIQQSRERYCRTSQEVADLLEEETEPQAPEHRTWIVDAQGTVFTSDRTQEYQDAKAAEGSVHMPAEPVREKADRKTGGQAHGATEPESRVDRKLMEYLEHTARSPFIPALQRDEMLKLSRYKGSLLRQRLTKLGWIRQHKANTGRKSGQLTLLEVTEAGYEFLASVKARVERPRGRGGFLHKYYAYKLKEYAEATWPSCDARIEDASQGRPADVTVRIPGPPQRVIALEIFMTGEAKEIRGIARDIELFDRVIVCAASPGALESLQARARDTLGEELLQKVEFHLISQYLMNEGPTGESGPAPVTSTTAPSPARRKTQPGKISYQKQKSSSEIEKSRPKSETEIENGPPPRKPGRRPRTPLLDQVEAAYLHLHDWEWLSECELANLPEVQERINHRQVMAEAQALRCLLFEAARQVIQDLDTVPDKVGVKGFLELHLEGRNVTAIARELGVTREWVSRSYRREAFRLAGMQFVRLVSRGH
jgi:DNA helicase HerA-like ATPase